MSGDVGLLTVFVLAVFVGYEVISKVSTTLHTPLMSGSNAISGIILLGAMTVAGSADSAVEHVLGFLAVTLGTINVVGGFAVTDRMLEMFKARPREPGERAGPDQRAGRNERPGRDQRVEEPR